MNKEKNSILMMALNTNIVRYISRPTFTVGTVEPSGITTFAVYEETNKLGLLQLLAYHTNSELDFDGFRSA